MNGEQQELVFGRKTPERSAQHGDVTDTLPKAVALHYGSKKPRRDVPVKLYQIVRTICKSVMVVHTPPQKHFRGGGSSPEAVLLEQHARLGDIFLPDKDVEVAKGP